MRTLRRREFLRLLFAVPASVLGNRILARSAPVTSQFEAQITESIGQAQRYLLSVQHADGYWVGIMESDPSMTAQYIILAHYLERVDQEKQAKAVAYILRQQNEDGGWPAYHFCQPPSPCLHWPDTFGSTSRQKTLTIKPPFN
ncbi:MAG: prenyltransferase/squalene oxidase repeat-containing protein [Candidatus Bipolaricaulia bacterium]